MLRYGGSDTALRLVQPENVESPMAVTPAGILILVRLVQLLNAVVPIEVTPVGIEILVSTLQPAKALLPMVTSPAGSSIPVIVLHPLKALASRLVTFFARQYSGTITLPFVLAMPRKTLYSVFPLISV